MHFKAILNLANSGKSTPLLSYDCPSSASRAPHTIVPYTWPLLRIPKSTYCFKLTALLLLVLMKTLPSIYMIRLANCCNCHLKIRPRSSISGFSKTSMDLILHSAPTLSSSHVRNISTVSLLLMDGRNLLLLFHQSILHRCLLMQ